MKILVTGSSGFIAKPLIKKLQEKGHEIEGYDITDNQDILNQKELIKVTKGKNLVYHFAAITDLGWARKHPLKTWDINVNGTKNVAHACYLNDVKMNYISTCSVYGNQRKHPTTEKSPINPPEFYACSKLAGEYAVLAYHKMYGLKYNILRLPTTYGPGMRVNLGLRIFISQALKNEPIIVHGNGKQIRTQTYIDDLVEGLVIVATKNVENEIINLTTTEQISALEMAKMVKKLLQKNIKIIHVQQRLGQILKENFDPSKAKRLLGWEAKTKFNEGLKKTINAQLAENL